MGASLIRFLKHNWVRLTAIALGFSMSEVAIAEISCTGFPQGSPNPIVEACELESDYEIRLGDETFIYSKHSFQDRIQEAARHWLATRQPSSELVPDTEIQIWLSVPESNPLAAQGRALVKTSRGNVVFSFDPRHADWVFQDSSTGILDSNLYPSSFGHRPSKILAKARTGSTPSAVIDSLMQAGAISATHEGKDYYITSCNPFEETQVARQAIKSNKDILQDVQVNSIFEWIADRQKIFEFRAN
jgi:hypothetical protein